MLIHNCYLKSRARGEKGACGGDQGAGGGKSGDSRGEPEDNGEIWPDMLMAELNLAFVS
jgi:hypothetical protein